MGVVALADLALGPARPGRPAVVAGRARFDQGVPERLRKGEVEHAVRVEVAELLAAHAELDGAETVWRRRHMRPGGKRGDKGTEAAACESGSHGFAMRFVGVAVYYLVGHVQLLDICAYDTCGNCIGEMNLRFLESFVAAAEEGHFGRAAARQFVTQSTLSRQIQGVEEEVGTALFDRTGRSAMLTPAGAAFLPEARKLLARARGATELARQVAGGRAGRLQVGFVGPAMFGLLPTALRRYRRDVTDVAVTLLERRTSAQREALIRGQIDLAVLHGGLGEGTADVPFTSEVLRHEARWIALSEDHPLAQEDGPIALSALAETPFVFFERTFEPVHFDAFVARCREAGFEPSFAQHADRIYIVLALVAAGMGAAPLTQPVTEALRYEGVVYRPLDEAGPPLPLCAVWRSDRATPVLTGFLDALRHTARS